MFDNPLEIHFQLADGNQSRFVLEDAEAANKLLAWIQPGHLFTNPEIMIGGTQSLTIIRTASIDCIDFITPGYPGWPFAPKVRDALTIPADVFQALVDETTHGLRSANIGLEGEEFDACVELQLSGGRKLYHALAMTSDPQSPVDRGLSLSHIFSRTVFVARRNGGGATIVNPAHVIQATFYPGPSETPPSAWLARHASPAYLEPATAYHADAADLTAARQ